MSGRLQTAASAVRPGRACRRGSPGRQFPLSSADKVANLQTSETGTFGVLQLRLRPDSYTWRFIPEPGQGTYTDSGSASCHGVPVRRCRRGSEPVEGLARA